MLYSDRDDAWKIADFGLTSEGTSKGFITTAFSRGNTGYRAPELLSEEGQHNNKSDIWSLGCMLCELATGKKPFPSDMDLLCYKLCDPSSRETIQLPAEAIVEKNWRTRISDIIGSTLSPEPLPRSSAAELYATFSNYCSLLQQDVPDMNIAQAIETPGIGLRRRRIATQYSYIRP